MGMGGGLKMDKLGHWLKRQMRAYETGKLSTRHVVKVFGREGVWVRGRP